MSEPLRINIVVFGRFTSGKLAGKINPNSTATVTLYNQIDPQTGHWESVKDRLARFRVESEDAMFKISSIDKLVHRLAGENFEPLEEAA